MKISTRSRYGLRLLFQLALSNREEALRLAEIAHRENISEKYLSQIALQLKHGGYIGSVRGTTGGYYLAKKPEEITVSDILETLDGSIFRFDDDTEGSGGMGERVAAKLWSESFGKIKDALRALTLADMVKWFRQDFAHLNYDI